MSVALIITSKHEPTDITSVPLDTEEGYYQAWFPIAEELGLTWVRSFGWGTPIYLHNVPEILAELETLRHALSAQDFGLTDDRIAVLIQRIERVADALQSTADLDVEIYIG